MKVGWEEVRLGDILTAASRWETPQIGTPYRQVGVRLWGQGAYERETIDGGQTKYSQLNRVSTNDVIVNKIWARNGSVAVVDTSLDGGFVSNEFPIFSVSDRVEARWIQYITKAKWFWDACSEKSQGTSGQNRIRPEKFLEIIIPLPPLEEQKRIVARVERLMAKVDEARGLREKARAEMKALGRSLIFGNLEQCLYKPMRELMRLRPADVYVDKSQVYDFAGVYSFGRGLFRSGLKSGSSFAYPKLSRLETNNFVYPKLMAWEGALAVVPEEMHGLVVSTEFPVFEIHQEKILPEVVEVFFRTPHIWKEMSGESTGTNLRRRRINPSDFLAYSMPVPPMNLQLQIAAAHKASLQFEKLQTQSQLELDALPASILARAFAGEL